MRDALEDMTCTASHLKAQDAHEASECGNSPEIDMCCMRVTECSSSPGTWVSALLHSLGAVTHSCHTTMLGKIRSIGQQLHARRQSTQLAPCPGKQLCCFKVANLPSGWAMQVHSGTANNASMGCTHSTRRSCPARRRRMGMLTWRQCPLCCPCPQHEKTPRAGESCSTLRTLLRPRTWR